MAGRPTAGGARRRGRTDGRRLSGGFRRSFARHAGAFSGARRQSGSRASVGRKAQGEKRNACGQAARMPNRPNAAQTCASRPRRLRGSRLA
ncbi:conserved hypothetical protein [Burkholderia mallei PRL-20]|uniref:Uncharacterized protein n=1 Tax=Burkholderia mallei (strain NCTC 10229) TaxID=412022 RepID=A2S9D6_BURM9|nr:hypothetical protein BMA10229_A2598 [Burkholderia mallei NCTC 10229]ABO04029.1 hypothetical protein BMA10247_2015 [Burkholderia mallei NCTC 10247]EDK53738.1 hypothetical protein BMAFMH_0378 [Burkholderia mallei FMH]EDK58706.1 hypothetical protein BMAJHU_0379 [Burkholderia mallei JHU]EEP88883.1 conserved hypothetical protein [Burkholderia mallei GB8 horse 4]EES47602.1 conserved hypothetical protein [Burkholderia mallei PRL-20]MXP96524.1 hypothetical protein [Burkholderia pseudomallei]